jgi:hypothetical protein
MRQPIRFQVTVVNPNGIAIFHNIGPNGGISRFLIIHFPRIDNGIATANKISLKIMVAYGESFVIVYIREIHLLLDAVKHYEFLVSVVVIFLQTNNIGIFLEDIQKNLLLYLIVLLPSQIIECHNVIRHYLDAVLFLLWRFIVSERNIV